MGRSPENWGRHLKLLLDTHILIRWLATPAKLSREQTSALRSAVMRGEPVAISAITLIEIGLLSDAGRVRLSAPEFFTEIVEHPLLEILPITIAIAAEFAAAGSSLHDPSDRMIVCTARVHNLRLVTSDVRIIDSKLVPVVT